MSKNIYIILIVFLSFAAGFMVNSLLANRVAPKSTKGVTGIGGIFFKCKDPAQMRGWYNQNLGLNTNQYGAVFEWYQGQDSTRKGFTQWSPFKESTKYFGKESQQYMINYRVENMDMLLVELRKNQVKVIDTVDSYNYGKFVHIEDLEGNKIELWEPNDREYEKMGIEIGAKTTK